jgi:hypothetical protein
MCFSGGPAASSLVPVAGTSGRALGQGSRSDFTAHGSGMVRVIGTGGVPPGRLSRRAAEEHQR